MKYQPSKLTYAVAAGVGAIASTPAAASIIEGGPVVAVSFTDFLVSSGLGASIGLTCLWVGQTLLKVGMRALAARERAKALAEQALAASTPGDEDDRAIAVSVAVRLAIAESLDESGKNPPFKGGDL